MIGKTTILTGLVLAALLPVEAQQIRPGGEERQAATRQAGGEDAREWAELQGPALGYWIRGRHVRLILGVPGAAHLSEEVQGPKGLSRVLAAPGHGWVLALGKREARAWRPETGETWALAGVEGLPDLTAISSTGREAAFYWEEGGRLFVFGGLPEAPRVLHTAADLMWPRDLRELALAPGGEMLAGVAEDGLYLLMPGAEAAPVALHPARGLRGVSFSRAGDRLAYVDAEAGALMVASRERDSFVVRPAVGAGDGLEAPERAGFDSFGAVWAVGTEGLWRVDSATGFAERFEAAGGQLEMLRLAGALLVSSPDEMALQVALVHDGRTELSWVPAPAAPVELAEAAGEVRQ